MYSLMFRFDVLPERREDFRSMCQLHAAECLREEPGTRGFRFLQDEEDPNRFYVFESYADPEACRVHNDGPILARTLAQGGPMLAGPTAPLGRGVEFYP
jgi:autoinducer 2-degrading protein